MHRKQGGGGCEQCQRAPRAGESEGNLAKIFKAAEELGGAIVFLDEIDSLATERGRARRRSGRAGMTEAVQPVSPDCVNCLSY